MGIMDRYLKWESEILRRAWSDAKQGLVHIGIPGELVIIAATAVAAWWLRAEYTLADAGISLLIGLAAAGFVSVGYSVWVLFIAPYRLHRDQSDRLEDIADDTYPDIDVDLGRGPEFFEVAETDGTKIQYIVLPDFTFVCREENGASLDWGLTIEFSEDRPRLSIRSTRRELPDTLEVPGWRDEPNVLSPPIDFPRPGARRGWLIFVSEGPGLWAQMAGTDTERAERGVFRVYLNVREYRSGVPGLPALKKSFGPWNMLVPRDWLNR